MSVMTRLTIGCLLLIGVLATQISPHPAALPTDGSVAAQRSAHASAVKRGPRGVRGPRGLKGMRGVAGSRGLQGAVGAQGATGPAGPQGPAGISGSDSASSLSINWRGNDAAAGRDSASINIAGIGVLHAECSPSSQTLTLTPAAGGVRTVANISAFESYKANTEQLSSTSPSTPIVLGSPDQPGRALPPNGMLLVTFSVQPTDGDGGSGPLPATLSFSSEYKVNDPDPTLNSCFLAGQVVAGGR
jgi:hypothetical protein